MIVKTDGSFVCSSTHKISAVFTRAALYEIFWFCWLSYSLEPVINCDGGRWQSRYSSSQQARSLLSLVLIAFVQVAGYGPNISFEINRYDQPPARSLNETF